VLNPDYRDMLSALSEAGVEHRVVGAHERTKDQLDIEMLLGEEAQRNV
jgi:hypothetical protein